jgi:geranylgeranyl reductase family protein
VTAEWDVAVAGAGPAGATSALLLARRGLRVVLFDRRRFPRPKACAEYMSPGVQEVLGRLGLGHVLDGACSISGMDVVSPSGRSIRLTYAPGGEQAFAVSLQRERFDTRLVAKAAAAGVDVREGVTVKHPILENGEVRGLRTSTSGRTEDVLARMTVIADGSRSALVASLGLDRPVRWPRRIGFVVYAEGVRFEDGFGRMFVSHGGYCGVAPLPDGLANVALVVPHDRLSHSDLSATRFLVAWIDAHPRLRRALAGARFTTPVRGVAQIGMRVDRPWYPGTVLVGDAAGFFDPFTGEGIYRALRGAELAASTVFASLEAPIRTDPLRAYARARSSAFRAKTGVTALVQFFVQRPALLEYAAPRLGARAEVLRTLGNVLGDTADPRSFLRPPMVWEALRP